jgi:hypothetical protein
MNDYSSNHPHPQDRANPSHPNYADLLSPDILLPTLVLLSTTLWQLDKFLLQIASHTDLVPLLSPAAAAASSAFFLLPICPTVPSLLRPCPEER